MCLQGNASLARAYRLFRTMGLHHLLIGPAKPPVMGIITRKVEALARFKEREQHKSRITFH